jgi:DNA-binding NarL/FixJ family response regulator
MSGILNPSVKTIETHRASAMRKLNITSTAALVRYAIRNKLIEP